MAKLLERVALGIPVYRIPTSRIPGIFEHFGINCYRTLGLSEGGFILWHAVKSMVIPIEETYKESKTGFSAVLRDSNIMLFIERGSLGEDRIKSQLGRMNNEGSLP